MGRKLIIGFDGEGTSEDALALGRLLAEVLDATPLVVAVFPYPDHLLGAADREVALSTLGKPVFDIANDRLQPLECETLALADESPAHALNELAEAEEPIAIVLGSAHRSSIGRLLLGSVGQSLLSGGPCAVAVAPRGFSDRQSQRLHRIGVAVNGTSESWSAFAVGVALAERVHGDLELLSFTPSQAPDLPGAVLSLFSREDLQTDEERRIRAVLEESEERIPTGLSARSRLLARKGVMGLVEAAEWLDLLIVGSRGYGPVRRALLGSTSTVLLRSTPTPILVLPRAAGSDPLGLNRLADLQRQEG